MNEQSAVEAILAKIKDNQMPTGEELGFLGLVNAAAQFTAENEGKNPSDYMPISTEEFTALLDALPSNEYKEYQKPMVSQHWISKNYAAADAKTSLANTAFEIIFTTIKMAIAYEDSYAYARSIPVIITKKDLAKKENAFTEHYMTDKDGLPELVTLASVILLLLHSELDQMKKHPRARTRFHDIKTAYKTSAVLSPFILDNYNRIMGVGYYQTADGQKISKEDARKKQLHHFLLPDPMERVEADANEILATIELTEAINLSWENWKSGSDSKSVLDQSEPPVFCANPNRPEALSKWDIIEAGVELFLPAAFSDGGGYTDKEIRDQREIFMQEFGALARALLDTIDTADIFSAKIKAANACDWGEITTTRQKLWNTDFANFRKYVKSLVWEDDEHAQFAGVSVIDEDLTPNTPHCIDGGGHFVKPDVMNQHADESILDFGGGDDAANVRHLMVARDMLLDSSYFLNGFDIAIRLIAERYGTPSIVDFSLGQNIADPFFTTINMMISIFYGRLSSAAYGTTEERIRKKRIADKVFKPLDVSLTRPPKEEIQWAKKHIKDMSAFAGDQLVQHLCIRKKQ